MSYYLGADPGQLTYGQRFTDDEPAKPVSSQVVPISAPAGKLPVILAVVGIGLLLYIILKHDKEETSTEVSA